MKIPVFAKPHLLYKRYTITYVKWYSVCVCVWVTEIPDLNEPTLAYTQESRDDSVTETQLVTINPRRLQMVSPTHLAGTSR